MNKKMKLRYRAALSLFLSMILLTMPAVAFSMNGNNAIEARAEEETESSAEEDSAGQETESAAEQETEGSTEESPGEQTESGTEEETEGGTVSGNEVEPVCTCEKKCGAYDYDKDCEVCAADYKDCEYKTPNVVININSPGGWHNERATVTFTVTDAAHTGNFEAAKIQAKVGQNGSWTDVTEDKKLEISENCTVYVQVTDQKGNTYERSRAVNVLIPRSPRSMRRSVTGC